MSAIPAATSAGETLLQALVNEIRQLPKPWEQTPEREQEVVIDRLRRAVESQVRALVGAIAGGNYPRIAATLESVTIKGDVKAVLKVGKGQSETLALADATGTQAMIVLASPQAYLDGIERVKADADQVDMFAQEQESPPVPEEWQALMDSIEQGPPEETSEGAEPAPPKSIGQQCQEMLAKVHVYVELEVCESWTEQQCTVAAYWAMEYAKDPEHCKVARPHWLPLPQPPEPGAENTTDAESITDDASGTSDSDSPADTEPNKKRRRKRGPNAN